MITTDTKLKQGDKIFPCIEIEGIFYWYSKVEPMSEKLYVEEDWLYNHNDNKIYFIVAKSREDNRVLQKPIVQEHLKNVSIGATLIEVNEKFREVTVHYSEKPKEVETEDNYLLLLDRDIPSVFSDDWKDGVKHQGRDLNEGHRESWMKGYQAAQSIKPSLIELQLAVEFGYKQCEKGNNLERALANSEQLFLNNQR